MPKTIARAKSRRGGWQRTERSIKIDAGKTYAWCRCGLSNGQPFCDGSHKTTEFRPLVWQATESEEVWLCRCKHTKNAPYCDGTHKTFETLAA